MQLADLLFGRPLLTDEEENQKVGPLAAIPMLGLDALASAAYGPEAAMTLLIPLGVAGLGATLPIFGIIVALLPILYLSYRQTTAAYPGGGGSYTVARENLGEWPGLVAAAALLIDYVLVVAVGIAAGAGALVSAVPALQPDLLLICLVILGLVTLVNLRGIKESGIAFVIPTYSFIAALGGVICYGVLNTVTHVGHLQPVVPPVAVPSSTTAVSLWILMRAFASGCTAMTGVEAISNGMTAFAQPRVKNAQRTLTTIVVILALMLLGIGYLCRAYGIYATDPLAPGYDSVVSQLTAAIAGRSWVYWVTIGSTLAVLALSANTGFADFPRLCRLLAEDHYLPHALATRGRRLVYSSGIVTLSLVAGALLVTFGGVTDRLIPLFAVGAFLAFTMSQIGMVVHWRRIRGHPISSAINALGAICTALALVVVLVAKFTEGAWITALVLPSLLAIFWDIHRHYSEVREATSIPSPVEPSLAVAPLVLVPIKQWDTISRKAVQFALSLSSDVVGVHVTSAADDGAAVAAQWEAAVSVPCAMRTSPVPSLAIVKSPYRTVMRPLLTYIEEVARAHPGRMLAVILPELVEAKWWHYFLHNQRATLLKALLLLHGDRQVVVINVPWYMEIDKP